MKHSGSILTTPEPTWGTQEYVIYHVGPGNTIVSNISTVSDKHFNQL